MAKRVAIVQRVLPHYRHEFFLHLREMCSQSDIQLDLFYGFERAGTVPQTKQLDVNWAHPIHNRYFSPKKSDLCWQSCFLRVRKHDLVIVEHANTLMLNVPLIAYSKMTKMKVGFWGHGRNYQASTRRLSDVVKDRTLLTVDWWFVYTRDGFKYVKSVGFKPKHISVVNNSIDTRAFANQLNTVSETEVATLRIDKCHGSRNISVFCGGLYSLKRLDFLLDACDLIRKRVPDFELVIIGDGPLAEFVFSKAQTRNWLHVVGALHGEEKAAYFRLAKVMLIPGVVGLAVLDGFVSGIPLVTTDISSHGPEIHYIDNGVNGVICYDTLEAYVESVCEILLDKEYRTALSEGALLSAKDYSIEAMSRNFFNGIKGALL